jgi:two-component system, NtrC family, sensor kinase
VTIAALPLLLFWMSIFMSILYSSLGMTAPSLLQWSYKWLGEVEQLCVAWFAVIFSWLLLLRFIQLRKEVVQQSLEKERLAKEKEMERAQLIEEQKIELEKTVEERTAELKYSLQELQSTQAQLIQSEKMASLGELTAGIAHEIQNPLNFVNNFSEVNTELVDELKSELATGNVQLANEIADNLKDNAQKINHHGKRADAIVKGMLQHSRASSGKKEPTDINALADEYLRLAYHGFRAKDKTFNASFQTDFDNSVRKINIVPQDIGRVMLNLINNAIYAVDEKKRQLDGGYEPTVSLTTKKLDGRVEISVKDNGNGIPQKVLDKIFQPFFTTKPTGQGTGLGLSLSYDIIKAHGGELKVKTIEGEGAEFIIELTNV